MAGIGVRQPSNCLIMQKVCVFCGSKPGVKSEYQEAAQSLALQLVERNIGLVYGGASVGIMGMLANHVLAGGGNVTGVIPQQLVEMEIAHLGLSQQHIVADMHTRKAMMSDLSDAFIALPGGLGTLEELFEALTWAQLKIHSKPIGLLNVTGYYDHLLSFLDHGLEQGYIKQDHRDLLRVADQPGALLDSLFC